MSTAGVQKKSHRQTSVAQTSTRRFDRELAELNASLARLEASVGRVTTAAVKLRPHKRAKPRREKSAAVKTPATVAPAAPVDPTPESPVASVQPPPASPIPAPPTGTDLADPKNFGLLPPTADLDRGTDSLENYRQRLGWHLAFATKVLHTSRVPAEVWREWRAFEKSVQERLRELANGAVGN